MLRSLGLSPSVIAISLIVVIANLGNSIVAPVLPGIQGYFGSSAAEVALMVSGFGIGRLAMDLPAGYLTERIGGTRMFSAGILISGVAAALAAFATSLPLLILFRTGMGFGSAIMSTVGMVMLAHGAKPNERGRVLAFYTSANLIGNGVGPALGGYLGATFDWRSVFLFCAFTPLISFPLNLLAGNRLAGELHSGPASEKADPERKSSHHHLPSKPTAEDSKPNWAAIGTVYVSSFLGFFNRQGMLYAVIPLYGGVVLGMDSAAIGWILALRCLFDIVIIMPAGALADRIGSKALLIPALLLVVAGNAYLVTGESLSIFTISTLLISFGAMVASLLATLTVEVVPARSMGKGMGMYRFTGDLGTVSGPFLLGLIVDHSGFTASSLVAGGMILLAAIGCTLLLPGRTIPTPARRAAQP